MLIKKRIVIVGLLEMFVGVLSAIRDMIGFTIVDKRWILLLQLRDAGYAAMDSFLQDNRGNLGQRASVDVRGMFRAESAEV